MPLLRKKPFEKKKPPPNLRPDEEVFHCKLTNELFRDYDEFYERVILCNSLIWSCSITGKPNITYAEALRSEASARNTLNEYPKELKLPVIYLASKTRRTCLRDLADDVYNYVRNRYFAGETVEVSLTDNHWVDCQILNVIAPSLSEVDRFVAMHGNGSSNEFWPPAALYQYEVRDISDKHTQDVMRFHCVPADKVRRRKGSFTRERNRLFLRQIAIPFDSGIWGIKEDFISKHQITHARYSLLFPGPLPSFQDSSKKGRIPPSPSKFISNKSKSPRKSSDSFVKSPTKDVPKKMKTMELHTPPSSSKLKNRPLAQNKENKVKSRKRKIKDMLKGSQMVSEEGVGPKKKRMIQQKLTAQVMDIRKVKKSENEMPKPRKPPTEEERRQMALMEKQRKIEERVSKRERIREEKRRLALHLKEWNKPREDLECEDLKHLPAPSAVQCRIPNQLFGDFLMVLEFVTCFKSVLYTENFFPGGLSFDLLEKALIEKEGTDTFADVVQLLLSSLFQLQEEEDHEVHETDSQAVVELDLAASTDFTREDAIQAATVATSWCQLYQGVPLKSLTLDCATLSELVRLHMLTSGGKCIEKNAKWRYQQRGGYTNFDDPGLLFRLEEPQILRALSVKTIFDLPLGCKLKILTCLVNQILTYAAVRDVIEDSVEKLKLAKVSLRQHQAGEIKREKDEAAARRKKRKEEKQKLKEGGVVQEAKPEAQSPKRDEIRRKQELQKKEKELRDAMATHQILARASPLGRDRAYRRFWLFNSLPGLFVEDNEELPGSCLPSPTPHIPALAMANDPEEVLACVQRMFEERGGNGSDKENEGGDRGLNSNHKKNLLGVKSDVELIRNPLVNRRQDSRAGSDIEEDAELNVKLANHLVCVADSKSCQVHSTFLPRTRWAFFSRETELDALVGALNPRGVRESHLRQVLLQHRTRIVTSMAKCPVHKLDHTQEPVEIAETRKSGRQQSKKDNSNFNFSAGLPVEEVFELTLRDYILDMEEKISLGGFGNLKVKDRDVWREAINSGGYDQQCDKLAWGNKDLSKGLKDAAFDKTVTKIKSEGKTSRPDTPDTTSVSSDGGLPSYEDPGGHLSIIKIEEDDQEDEEDSGVIVNGTSDSLLVKPVVRQLASAILQVAQCIEQRYLKKPLAEDQKSLEKRLKVLNQKKKSKDEEVEEGSEDGKEKDDILTSTSPMERWETSLMASTSISQLYLHFYTLDNSIQWSKSALFARCRVCRKQGDGENMLLCDGCNKGYHLYCLKPKLTAIPLGDWFCNACRPPERTQPPRKSRRLFSEESDEEEEEEDEEEEEEESEEGSVHNETCHQCGVGGHVICCDTCPLVFHMECTDPPLRKVPRGAWSCPKCKPHHFANHQVKKDTDSTQSSEDRNKRSSLRRKRAEEEDDDDDEDLEEKRRRSASLRGQRRMRRSEIFDGVPAPLDLDILESLLADIARHADAWPFMRPVLKSEAPDYHLIIKRPMDFGTMKYKLKIMEYKNNNEFLADALLVFENCQMYNNSSTPEYKAGVRLSRYFERRCKELELTLHEVEKGTRKVSRQC